MPQRPLSPHLQIYRLPLTAVLSITHRLTGVLLMLGMMGAVACVMSAAAGPQPYDAFRGLIGSLPGRLFIWAWLFALSFHLCHGIRHLIWDLGRGFDRRTLGRYAVAEIVAALALAALMLILS